MEQYKVEATKFTPFVSLDAEKNLVEIKGESYPENTAEFFSPIVSWLQTYFGDPDSQMLQVNMEIIYFNSSSSKVLMDIFDLFEENAREGKKVVVDWIYDQENESALEYGEEFQEDLKDVTFNLVVKESN